MPRLAPNRHWDLDITKMEGARPQAGRPYPVAPQYLPELNRQIEVLERAGITRPSKSLYGAPVLFAPKKDGKRGIVTFNFSPRNLTQVTSTMKPGQDSMFGFSSVKRITLREGLY